VIPVAAWVELDAAALLHNAKKVRDYAPKSKVVAVIKANAYGHGAIKVAQILEPKVDAFAVARLGEALALRKSGVKAKILVLQGFSQAEELSIFITEKLDAVVHSEEQVRLLESNNSQKIKVWLKIDTGMNRLGIQPAQFQSLFNRLKQCASVNDNIKLMSHFANADDRQDLKTELQYSCFLDAIGAEWVEKSIANSAAIIAWPATQQDWVRAGLMLYGASPLKNEAAQSFGLKPVMNFYAQVIAVKQVQKGQAVGYGGTWVADKTMQVAVVSIGYGDGYPRELKAGTPVLINQQRLPIVGRVSMDMLTVDLTGTVEVNIGDKVTLWGEGLPVDEIAEYADTIAYTLMCGITSRVNVLWSNSEVLEKNT